MELETAERFGKLPHEWDKAPRWSRTEAIAYHVIKRVLEHWGYLSAEERKTLMNKVPRISHG